jgi:hypothetical protein
VGRPVSLPLRRGEKGQAGLGQRCRQFQGGEPAQGEEEAELGSRGDRGFEAPSIEKGEREVEAERGQAALPRHFGVEIEPEAVQALLPAEAGPQPGRAGIRGRSRVASRGPRSAPSQQGELPGPAGLALSGPEQLDAGLEAASPRPDRKEEAELPHAAPEGGIEQAQALGLGFNGCAEYGCPAQREAGLHPRVEAAVAPRSRELAESGPRGPRREPELEGPFELLCLDPEGEGWPRDAAPREGETCKGRLAPAPPLGYEGAAQAGPLAIGRQRRRPRGGIRGPTRGRSRAGLEEGCPYRGQGAYAGGEAQGESRRGPFEASLRAGPLAEGEEGKAPRAEAGDKTPRFEGRIQLDGWASGKGCRRAGIDEEAGCSRQVARAGDQARLLLHA